MIAGADAGVRALELLGEGVVDLLGQGPVRDEVGVGAGVRACDGAVDAFAADVGLPLAARLGRLASGRNPEAPPATSGPSLSLCDATIRGGGR